jgi:serine/threonine protein phosphatase PrpC
VTHRDGRIDRIQPSVVTVREFQQALKRFYLERCTEASGNGSAAGQVPLRLVEELLHIAEEGLTQRLDDRSGEPLAVTDRWQDQQVLQEAEGIRHRLVALGRYHRRRGDYVGGGLEEDPDVGFGFTTGAQAGHFHRDPNEDALGIDRAETEDLFVVADAHHGGRSSELAVKKLLDLFQLAFEAHIPDREIASFLTNAIVRCHHAIRQDLQVERSMTSVAAVVRRGRRCFWASVSDAFLFRYRSGRLQQVNRDLGQGVAGRKLSIWLGDTRFQRRYIDRGDLELGDDWLVLATDGIMKHRKLPAGALLTSLQPGANAAQVSHRLARHFAEDGQDNASFILLRGRGES